MKKLIVCAAALLVFFILQGQSINKIISTKQVKKIEKILSADNMEGRRTFTPGIAKASSFIEKEFKKIGLQTFNGAANYRQDFLMCQSVTTSITVTIDGQPIADSLVACFSNLPQVSLTQKSGVDIVSIKAGDNAYLQFYKYIASKKSLVILVDTSFTELLQRAKKMDKLIAASDSNSIIFIAGNISATHFSINISNTITNKELNNVVGMLPGKSRPAEYVIFSGHYDHLGVGSPVEGAPHNTKDSIYNGANDDAAGTTAVIMLAKYFKKLDNNERTIIFVTFAAEELGGYGSQYFSTQLKPEKVVSMFNIEMIGTDSKWGLNSAYITGFEKSDMGTILQKNLKGTSFAFYPDPYTEQELFYRSDNATLARLGVPAHTISTSKMDNEPNYHKASDEMGTLDMVNMAAIIKAIAISSSSIVNGTDTPSRVDTIKLK